MRMSAKAEDATFVKKINKLLIFYEEVLLIIELVKF